jgi:hypothetical protein
MSDPEEPVKAPRTSTGLSLFIERRRAVRHVAVVSESRLAWHEGGGRFRVVSAELVDISDRAARLIFDGPLEEGRAVWLGLATLPWEWVGATVRAITRPDRSGHYVVEFRESCPPGLIEHATDDEAELEADPPIDVTPNFCWGG